MKEIRLDSEFPAGDKVLSNRIKRGAPWRRCIKHGREVIGLPSSRKAGQTKTGDQTTKEGE